MPTDTEMSEALKAQAHAYETEIVRLRARISALESALWPFSDAATIFIGLNSYGNIEVPKASSDVLVGGRHHPSLYPLFKFCDLYLSLIHI